MFFYANRGCSVMWRGVAEPDGGAGSLLPGRGRALATMAGALRDGPSIVFVEGAAGTGKSTLVAAALRSAGRPAEEVTCRPGAVPPPLPHPVSGVLVVEDVQWLPEAGRSELRQLAAELTGPACLVVTYRPDEVRPTGLPLGAECRPARGVRAVAVRLAPLDRAEVGELIGSAGVPGGITADELYRSTGGIPALLVAQLQTGSGPAAGADVGPLVAQWLAQRRASLPRSGQQVLAAATVFAAPATTWQLATVAEVSDAEVTDTLCVLLSGALVREAAPGRYEMTAELLRRWLYRQIPAPHRQRLHARAAAAIGADDPADRVALMAHCRAAGDTAAAVKHAEAASEAAVVAGDSATAIELLQSALAEPTTVAPTRARLAVRLARIATVGLRREDTVAVLRRLVRDNPLPAGVRGEIRLGLGLLLMNQAGQGDAGRSEIARAGDELRRRPALAARAMSALAMPQWGDCHADEHMWWLAQAEQAAARGRDRALSTAVFANRVSLLMNLGDPAVWREIERLPAHEGTLAQQQQVGRAYANLTDAAVWLGHYAAAGRFSAHARRLATHTGAEYVVALTRSAELRMEWALGRWAQLDRRAERLLKDLRTMPLLVADGRLTLAQLAVARGEWSEALALLDVPQLRDVDDGCGPELSAASAVRVRAWLGAGEPGHAHEEGRRALERERAKGVWGWSGELVRAAVEALVLGGHLAEARAATADLAAGIADRDAPLSAASVTSCRAMLAEATGDAVGAEALHAQAQREYERLPRPFDAAREAEALARCRIAGGHPGADLLMLAAERYTALGAAYDTARCEHLLRSQGAGGPRRRGRRGYGAELSPREHDVARLMGLGRTNRQIAELLFLSTRTVEVHAARVLRKLGVTDRAHVAQHLPGAPVQ